MIDVYVYLCASEYIQYLRLCLSACVCIHIRAQWWLCSTPLRIVIPLSAHRVGGWLGLLEMQAQAYLIWIMYKTLIEAVCLHQSGVVERGQGERGGVVEREEEREREILMEKMIGICKLEG